ncbi:DUF397 domain-containing protein [Streptomyces sp. H39-S7]|uniref:DUF397 domain-containing protein n=1 Tax=Streptomyces sp. H39-S7 TaxID=3004357 RepID=UPI0022AE8259|nr:DUF397 domain-containing protein [Streptomyces sp. H39-S7]MCZ4122223.1 DUF397 domain-containing protein [Streptomyces sp. H39-S7]
MTDRIWQKSSFSGTGISDNCLEVMAAPTGQVHFRESDRPGEILTTTPARWAAFLRRIKADEVGAL